MGNGTPQTMILDVPNQNISMIIYLQNKKNIQSDKPTVYFNTRIVTT